MKGRETHKRSGNSILKFETPREDDPELHDRTPSTYTALILTQTEHESDWGVDCPICNSLLQVVFLHPCEAICLFFL